MRWESQQVRSICIFSNMKMLCLANKQCKIKKYFILAIRLAFVNNLEKDRACNMRFLFWIVASICKISKRFFRYVSRIFLRHLLMQKSQILDNNKAVSVAAKRSPLVSLLKSLSPCRNTLSTLATESMLTNLQPQP